MRTRFLTLEQLDQSDERAWRGLAARSAETNPFFEPEFVLPAARHLGLRGEGCSWPRRAPTGRRASR